MANPFWAWPTIIIFFLKENTRDSTTAATPPPSLQDELLFASLHSLQADCPTRLCQPPERTTRSLKATMTAQIYEHFSSGISRRCWANPVLYHLLTNRLVHAAR